jgi:ribosome biogenesis protein BRX1
MLSHLQGSFGGPTLYETPHYQSPNILCVPRSITVAKHKEKQNKCRIFKNWERVKDDILPHDPTEDVFAVPAEEKTIEI